MELLASKYTNLPEKQILPMFDEETGGCFELPQTENRSYVF